MVANCRFVRLHKLEYDRMEILSGGVALNSGCLVAVCRVQIRERMTLNDEVDL